MMIAITQLQFDDIRAYDKIKIFGSPLFFEVVIGRVFGYCVMIRVPKNVTVKMYLKRKIDISPATAHIRLKADAYFNSLEDDDSHLFAWVDRCEITGIKGYRSVPL